MASINQINPLFFFKTPPLENLVGVTLQCEQSSRTNNKAVLKCRQIIFENAFIIASPCLRLLSQIKIVLQKELWKSDDFASKLRKLGLLANCCPFPASLSDIQECLKYTITAKLAPNWNEVANVFIQGRDFLLSNELQRAICMDMTVTCNYIQVSVQAMGIRLIQNKMGDLCDGPEKCQRLVSQLEAGSEVILTENRACYVLPSMRQGTVYSITKSLTKGNPYHGTYSSMKKYWKNLHGYRLPDDEGDLSYVNVCFGNWGRKTFLYPELCVRFTKPVFVYRVDPQPIISHFLTELQTKVRYICGEPLQLETPQAFFPVPALYPASIDPQKEKIGLSENISTPVPLRELGKSQVMTPIQMMVSQYLEEINNTSVRQEQVQQSSLSQKIIPVFNQNLNTYSRLTQFQQLPTLSNARILSQQISVPKVTLKTEVHDNRQTQMTSVKTQEQTPAKSTNNESTLFQLPLLPTIEGNYNQTVTIQGPTTIVRTPTGGSKVVDIFELARKNELHKASAASLSFWLKEQGFYFKVKTRKQELIKAVQLAIGNQQKK